MRKSIHRTVVGRSTALPHSQVRRPSPRRADDDEMAQHAQQTSLSALDRDELVASHLWLADRLARHMWRRFPSHVDRNELYAAALLGLTEAAHRFDPSRGVPFAAFASPRVRGEIVEVARSVDIVPRRLRREMRDVVEVDERLTHELRRRPSDDELAAELRIDTQVVRRRLADLKQSAVASLDVDSSRDSVPVDELSDPSASVFQRERDGAVREAVERLPEPLRSIIIRIHWNDDRLVDIATDMNVSFQRVAQYKLEALRTLAVWLSMIDDTYESPGDGFPGVKRRADYCADMLLNSTWRTRLERGIDDERPVLRSATG